MPQRIAFFIESFIILHNMFLKYYAFYTVTCEPLYKGT